MNFQICPNCGHLYSGELKCSNCDIPLVKTSYEEEKFLDAGFFWSLERLIRFTFWKYANPDKKKEFLLESTKEQLENVCICPRCGDTYSDDNTNNCQYCGCTLIPTKYKWDNIIKMEESEYFRIRQKMYNEYCYHNPLFDKMDFHRRRIQNDEEPDPKKELAEIISEASSQSSWGLAMDPMELAGYSTTFDDNDN